MKIQFVPQDFWLGLYWKTETDYDKPPYGCSLEEVKDALYSTRTYYLCLVPCFPIIWKRRVPPKLWKSQRQLLDELVEAKGDER